MKDLSFMLPEEEKEALLKELIKKRKKEVELEEECKALLSKFFGDELNYDKINSILKENGFNGIYVLSDREYESLFPGSLATYASANVKAVFISKTDSFRRDALCHELVHALIDNRMKPLCSIDEFKGLATGIEEGIATTVAKNLKVELPLNERVYYSQVKFVNQLNVLYKYSKNKKYSNFFVQAILEPTKVIPLINEIYSNIMKNFFREDRDIINTEYRTSYNLLFVASELLNELDIEMLLLMTYINFLYYAMTDEKVYFGEYSDEIKEIFLIGNPKDIVSPYDSFIYNICGPEALKEELYRKIVEKNLAITNRIETIDLEKENQKQKRK